MCLRLKEDNLRTSGVSSVVWKQRILISNRFPQVIVGEYRLPHSRIPKQHDSPQTFLPSEARNRKVTGEEKLGSKPFERQPRLFESNHADSCPDVFGLLDLGQVPQRSGTLRGFSRTQSLVTALVARILGTAEEFWSVLCELLPRFWRTVR